MAMCPVSYIILFHIYNILLMPYNVILQSTVYVQRYKIMWIFTVLYNNNHYLLLHLLYTLYILVHEINPSSVLYVSA